LTRGLFSSAFWKRLLQHEGVQQMWKFMTVGFVSLGLSLVIFYFASAWLKPVIPDWHFRTLAANTTAFCVTITNAFVLNSRFTFQGRDANAAAYCRYGLVNVIGFAINSGLLLVFTRLIAVGLGETPQHLVDSRPIAKMGAFLAAVGCSFFWNFFMSRWWVFRHSSDPASAVTLVHSNLETVP
jgi:putative flippase GtrA